MAKRKTYELDTFEHYYFYYPYLIMDSQVRVSGMGPLRSGLRCRTNGLGQYKTHGIEESSRIQVLELSPKRDFLEKKPASIVSEEE